MSDITKLILVCTALAAAVTLVVLFILFCVIPICMVIGAGVWTIMTS